MRQLYQLVIIDNSIAGPIEDRECVFRCKLPEWGIAEAGARWIRNYPEDIAMLVECEDLE